MKSTTVKIAIVLLLTASITLGDRVLHTRQACRYVHAYQQVKDADASMNLVERLLCTVVVAHARDIV